MNILFFYNNGLSCLSVSILFILSKIAGNRYP